MKMQTDTIKIAIADDHVMLRKSLAKVMNGLDGVEVMFDEDNGKKLLQRLKTTEVLPDVCILDINMPELDGYDTARCIKQGWPSIKILALSMYDTEFNVIKMIRSGACGYVLKDAPPDELYTAVQKILDHGVYFSELKGNLISKALTNQPLCLDEKDVEFLRFCCTDLTYRQIAEKMFKSPRTIDGYRESLFTRFNISSRTGLALLAVRFGLVQNAEL